MEPRAAVAEWSDGDVTVWAGTSSPFPVRNALAKELGIPEKQIRAIVPYLSMGLGGALWEEIRFDNGRILNAGFGKYRVPRFSDVPELDVILMERPDLPSTGAGETPIITIAAGIANAVFAATGKRIRSMPIQAEYLKMV